MKGDMRSKKRGMKKKRINGRERKNGMSGG